MTECDFCGEEFEDKNELHLHWEEHEEELNSHQKEKVKKAKRKKKKEEDRKKEKMAERKKKFGYGLAGALGLALIAVLGIQLLPSGGTNSFDLQGQPTIGNESADISIVVFEDYKCPYCAQFQTQIYPQLKEQYIKTGQVKLTMINYPFLAPDSTTAAVAAECVYNQDEQQYWDFHQAVFQNQGPESQQWATVDTLMQIARESTQGLDYDQLRTCIDNQETLEAVNRDKRVASQAGVRGTPTVFINGEQIQNWRFNGLKQAIQSRLN